MKSGQSLYFFLLSDGRQFVDTRIKLSSEINKLKIDMASWQFGKNWTVLNDNRAVEQNTRCLLSDELLSDRGVYVDEYDHQEIEDGSDDAQYS